jgi:hypothetical protein
MTEESELNTEDINLIAEKLGLMSKIRGKHYAGGGIAAVIAAVGTWAWAATGDIHGYIQQITANTEAIQMVSTSLKLGRVNDEIADLKRERRELRRELRDDPENDLILEQIEVIDDELEELEKVRECIMKGGEVCESG